MKYNPDSYSEYPRLRPNSDDYPNGQFLTKLIKEEFSQSGGETDSLRLKLDFDIDEPVIRGEVRDGDAVCCAQLYCATTCYSEMFIANTGEFFIEQAISLGNIRGRVELRPLVLTINDIAIRTETAHPEYGGNMLPVARYKQLAVCEPYHFSVGFIGTVESVFRLEQTDGDSNLNDGEFEYEADPLQRYIRIKMNAETYQTFQRMRSQESLTRMTVYLIALTDALANLPEDASDDDIAEGWVTTIREHLNRNNLDVPDRHSYGLAAQRLLESPLKQLPYIVSRIEGEETS